jgi:hypothetical protein
MGAADPCGCFFRPVAPTVKVSDYIRFDALAKDQIRVALDPRSPTYSSEQEEPGAFVVNTHPRLNSLCPIFPTVSI